MSGLRELWCFDIWYPDLHRSQALLTQARAVGRHSRSRQRSRRLFDGYA